MASVSVFRYLWQSRRVRGRTAMVCSDPLQAEFVKIQRTLSQHWCHSSRQWHSLISSNFVPQQYNHLKRAFEGCGKTTWRGKREMERSLTSQPSSLKGSNHQPSANLVVLLPVCLWKLTPRMARADCVMKAEALFRLLFFVCLSFSGIYCL